MAEENPNIQYLSKCTELRPVSGKAKYLASCQPRQSEKNVWVRWICEERTRESEIKLLQGKECVLKKTFDFEVG